MATSAPPVSPQRGSGQTERFAIQDYWITNLNARVLEVNRDPAPDPTAEYGCSYRTRIVVRQDESIAPLAAPGKPVRAADVLP